MTAVLTPSERRDWGRAGEDCRVYIFVYPGLFGVVRNRVSLQVKLDQGWGTSPLSSPGPAKFVLK